MLNRHEHVCSRDSSLKGIYRRVEKEHPVSKTTGLAARQEAPVRTSSDIEPRSVTDIAVVQSRRDT